MGEGRWRGAPVGAGGRGGCGGGVVGLCVWCGWCVCGVRGAGGVFSGVVFMSSFFSAMVNVILLV